MQPQRTQPILLAVKWIGGWGRFILLLLVIVGVVVGLLWERQRGVPLPPEAQSVTSDINAGATRQTTFTVPGSPEQARAFYRQALPERGWSYCGTQATAGCTNMIALNDGSAPQIDVYRRPEDTAFNGRTIEVWPIRNARGETFVTIFETREP